MSTSALKVTLGTIAPVGWVCAALFLAAAAAAALAGQYLPAAGFLPFVALGGAVIVGSRAEYRFTEESVEHRGVLGVRNAIAWRDVTEVEFGNGGTFALRGKGRRFVVSPPGMWSGPDAAKALELLAAKTEGRGLPLRRRAVADYYLGHRNCRIG